MAWTKYQMGLAFMMLVTGSLNTLSTKWADRNEAVGSDGTVHGFDHPFLQAVGMFLGELSCLAVFHIVRLINKYRNKDMELGNQSFNPLIFLAPAMCDMCGTSTMYLGLTLTYASSFQMLRGAVIIFTALLSVAFLQQSIKCHMWTGIVFVILGLATVGMADILFGDHSNEDLNGIIAGKPSSHYDRNNPDWAPTLNMGHSKIRDKSAIAIARTQRVNKRKAMKKRNDAAENLLAFHEHIASSAESSDQEPLGQEQDDVMAPLIPEGAEHEATDTEEMDNNQGSQTDMTQQDLKQTDEEMQHLRDELYELRQKTSDSAFSENGFRDKDDKVKFYTGLPSFKLLMVVFNFIAPYVSYSHRNSLSQFQEFILVLMRLRLNLPLQDLAFRFNVSMSTISRIFEKWIDMMDIRLKHLIAWPEREILRHNMPYDFVQAFGDKVAVIIDCFEIFIDRPSNLMARAQTWSNYKHHNTVKFLIGVTPQGVISFISKGWGGRVSDKYLTENCSLLSNLLPGDIVLADRGFDISDSVGFYCAKLAIPAFTRGKKQLSALEVEKTRKIANVRIHVERVIGAVRQKYQILGSNLTLELVTCKEGQSDSPIDKIVRVCCSLTNLCPSVVSMN